MHTFARLASEHAATSSLGGYRTSGDAGSTVCFVIVFGQKRVEWRLGLSWTGRSWFAARQRTVRNGM